MTDPTVDSQILQLRNSNANVFFNVTTPKFGAQAIKKTAEIGWKMTHYLVSVAASVGAVMRPAGVENAQGIITAQFLKDITDPIWKDDEEYKTWKAFMEKWNPTANPLEGSNVSSYAVVHALVHVLKQCGDELTRENIMHQAASLKDFHVPLLLPGMVGTALFPTRPKRP